MKQLMFALVVAAAALTAGCKKKHYSSNCSRDVGLSAPWNTLALPTGDGRVCSSNDLKTDVEHLTGDRAAWETKYGEALTAQGFAKDKCLSTSCSYAKAGEKINVHVNQVATGKKAKTIVHLTRTPSKEPAVAPGPGSGSGG